MGSPDGYLYLTKLGMNVLVVSRSETPEIDNLPFVHANRVESKGTGQNGYVVELSEADHQASGVFAGDRTPKIEIYNYDGDGTIDEVRRSGFK